MEEAASLLIAVAATRVLLDGAAETAGELAEVAVPRPRAEATAPLLLGPLSLQLPEEETAVVTARDEDLR